MQNGDTSFRPCLAKPVRYRDVPSLVNGTKDDIIVMRNIRVRRHLIVIAFVAHTDEKNSVCNGDLTRKRPVSSASFAYS